MTETVDKPIVEGRSGAQRAMLDAFSRFKDSALWLGKRDT